MCMCIACQESNMILTSTFTTGLRRTLPALALAASGLALTGCVVAPAYPGDVVYAPSAPPPLQTEVIPVAPSPVHVWINGYWGWGGASYAWRPGHWAMPPRPGYMWHQPAGTMGRAAGASMAGAGGHAAIDVTVAPPPGRAPCHARPWPAESLCRCARRGSGGGRAGTSGTCGCQRC